jgi:hypothetical protein
MSYIKIYYFKLFIILFFLIFVQNWPCTLIVECHKFKIFMFYFDTTIKSKKASNSRKL